ncbi:MAG: HNH endonuclease [Paludibacteraceae bacterium]|nr:HNH endonuclease [Paludibacteraceae bacterium]
MNCASRESREVSAQARDMAIPFIKPLPLSGVEVANSLFLIDGSELRLCADARSTEGTAKLYCSYDGHFYSLSQNGLNEILPRFSPSNRANTRGSKKYTHKGTSYPVMQHFGGKSCHSLICTAWHGPRPTFIDEHGNEKPMECDHLNANPYDFHADNLEWVTPAENRRRAKILRGLRSAGIEPEKAYTYAQLKDIFNTYDIQNN